jgi:hypothetical protein
MMKRFLILGALSLALTAAAAEAQRASHHDSGPIELGIDGGVTFGLGNGSGTVVSLPTQVFRLGYFLSDDVEIEPRVSINSISGGGASVTAYSMEAGVLFQPAGDRVGKGLYLRPFLGVSGVNVSGGGGNNNSGYAGAGFGLKLPFADRRLAARMEANYAHGFSGGSNLIGLLIGLSFFTR